MQLIFASHSPMLLSDIPHENVVLLSKHQRGRPDESIGNTFGANIFDLYRYSFFLKEGTVGAFAQDKIDTVLNKVFVRLKNENLETIAGLDKNDKLVARLIGDERVRRYLQGWIDALESGC